MIFSNTNFPDNPMHFAITLDLPPQTINKPPMQRASKVEDKPKEASQHSRNGELPEISSLKYESRHYAAILNRTRAYYVQASFHSPSDGKQGRASADYTKKNDVRRPTTLPPCSRLSPGNLHSELTRIVSLALPRGAILIGHADKSREQ